MVAASQSFSAQVEEWCRKVDGAVEAIFLESVQELVEQSDEMLRKLVYESPPSPNYKRTGFLRSSLMVSKTGMPLANRPQGKVNGGYMTTIDATIKGSDITETIYVGWTANYAAFVHYGANGRPPRPWVSIVAQRWQAIVAAKTAELKGRLGI